MKPKEHMRDNTEDKSLGKTSERESFWQSHIQAYQKSDMTRKAYCQEQGIDYHRFQYWYYKQNTSPLPSKAIPIVIKETLPQPKSDAVLCTLKLSTGQHLSIYDPCAFNLLLDRLL